MCYRKLKNSLKPLMRTPFHPQWFAHCHDNKGLSEILKDCHGTVIDIGCAERKPVTMLPSDINYIGLDHPNTSIQLYGTTPDIFGDAHALPFASASADTVLLLDVLEHLSHPEEALEEIYRILRPGGILLIQVPFLYPIHDAPLDFRRWTVFGLRQLAQEHGFKINDELPMGRPLESSALNTNIALANSLAMAISKRHPSVILLLLWPVLCPLINIFAWILARLLPTDVLMPMSYRMTWKKI